MAVEIVMPRLGWTAEEGAVAEWIKQDGDWVEVGDIVFTVESDKAINEIEAFDAGILRIPPDSPGIGEVVPIGTLLAYLMQHDEPVPFESETNAGQGPLAQTGVGSVIDRQATTPSSTEPRRMRRKASPTISPRARRVANELGVDWQHLQGSGRTGRIIERDIRAAVMPRTITTVDIRATPATRRLARTLGVDLVALAAQAPPGSRIDRRDVEAAAQSRPLHKPNQPATPITETTTPLNPVRRLISERMTAGSQTTAPVTLTTEADATELVRLRTQLRDDAPTANEPIPSYNDLLSKLTAQALQEHPALNARLEGDAIISGDSVHIGQAVDTGRGLLVPVIRDVQSKSLRQLAQESITLTERTRAGQLRPEEMMNGTFTITNLGMYEIDAFTPIINLPECAILGVGRIVPKQVIIDLEAERVAIRQMMFLSLTFDHRLVDGAPAARFLQRIKQFVEKPYLWLVT